MGDALALDVRRKAPTMRLRLAPCLASLVRCALNPEPCHLQDVKDTHAEATVAAPQALKLCQMVRARHGRERRGPCCRCPSDLSRRVWHVSNAVGLSNSCSAVNVKRSGEQGLDRVQWKLKNGSVAGARTHAAFHTRSWSPASFRASPRGFVASALKRRALHPSKCRASRVKAQDLHPSTGFFSVRGVALPGA